MNRVLSSCGTRINATVKEEMDQGRVMTAREQKGSEWERRRFQPADLCDRERNRFSSVVPMLDVALQVDVNEFKDQI